MANHGKPFDVRNPRTGQVDYHFISDSPEDVAAKARALRAGQVAWGAMALEVRIKIVLR